MDGERDLLRAKINEQDKKLAESAEKIASLESKVKTAKEKYDKLMMESKLLGIHSDSPAKSEAEIECGVLEKKLDKVHKDAYATNGRVIVHINDQQKTIVGLEKKIALAKETLASKSQYILFLHSSNNNTLLLEVCRDSKRNWVFS